ncbi:hypothetical protein N8K70_08235 [Microbacterium betulae]|uniref:Uncharacterized protein n=1 Tax=Microbacterium betulae TaxID=2981139 RepID=A0AA97I7U0_9MICO|nr:hypothetical protein [Microbacterium sp. AB]WOF24627.1 hypothetical protein N8K70_08235 [Microbacterium sp. AB]
MTSPIRVSVEHTDVCLHEAGALCAEVGPGHDMHMLQRRVVAATPSRWVDAIAGATSEDGWLDLHGLDGRVVTRVWHHESLRRTVLPGEPVALHAGYHVLSVGDTWLNVRDECDS